MQKNNLLNSILLLFPIITSHIEFSQHLISHNKVRLKGPIEKRDQLFMTRGNNTSFPRYRRELRGKPFDAGGVDTAVSERL